MNKRIIQLIPSIIFYIFAGLLVAYAIWAYSNCAEIISQAKTAGQLSSNGNEYDIVSFYMGNCGQYFVFALLLAAAGIILQKKQNIPSGFAVVNKFDNEVSDSELDEWFNEDSLTDKAEAKEG